MGEIVFQTGNPGKLPVSGCMAAFMIAMFSIPLFAIPTTFPLLGEHPVLIPFTWLAACFPLAVLYVLARLMGRYALRVGAAGWVEIVFPFRTQRLQPGDFAAIVIQNTSLAVYTAGGAMKRADVKFVRADGKVAAFVALSAFSAAQWEGFLAAVREVRPEVAIQA